MAEQWEVMSEKPSAPNQGQWEVVSEKPISQSKPFIPQGPVMYGAEGSPDWQTTKNFLEGAASGIIGGPGDLAKAAHDLPAPLRESSAITQAASAASHVLPTSGEIGKTLFGEPETKAEKTARKLGEITSGIVSPMGMGKAGVKTASEIAKGAEAVRAATSLKRAQEGLTAIGDTSSDLSILGSKMYKDVRPKFNELLKKRREEADQYKKEYFSTPHEVEANVANLYRGFLIHELTTRARDLTPEQAKIIKESWDRLGHDPSAVALEAERRHLNEIASGDAEGFSATTKLFAGELGNTLTGILRSKIPASGKFIDAYSAASAPINLFKNTTGGKKFVRDASEYLPEMPRSDVRELPTSFFKSKQTMDQLRQFSGGDEKFVNNAAGEFAAIQLEGKNAKEAREWATKNREWLDQVPKVQREVDGYVKNLERVTLTRKAIGLGILGAGIGEGYGTIRRFLGQVL